MSHMERNKRNKRTNHRLNRDVEQKTTVTHKKRATHSRRATAHLLSVYDLMLALNKHVKQSSHLMSLAEIDPFTETGGASILVDESRLSWITRTYVRACRQTFVQTPASGNSNERFVVFLLLHLVTLHKSAVSAMTAVREDSNRISVSLEGFSWYLYHNLESMQVCMSRMGGGGCTLYARDHSLTIHEVMDYMAVCDISNTQDRGVVVGAATTDLLLRGQCIAACRAQYGSFQVSLPSTHSNMSVKDRKTFLKSRIEVLTQIRRSHVETVYQKYVMELGLFVLQLADGCGVYVDVLGVLHHETPMDVAARLGSGRGAFSECTRRLRTIKVLTSHPPVSASVLAIRPLPFDIQRICAQFVELPKENESIGVLQLLDTARAILHSMPNLLVTGGPTPDRWLDFASHTALRMPHGKMLGEYTFAFLSLFVPLLIHENEDPGVVYAEFLDFVEHAERVESRVRRCMGNQITCVQNKLDISVLAPKLKPGSRVDDKDRTRDKWKNLKNILPREDHDRLRDLETPISQEDVARIVVMLEIQKTCRTFVGRALCKPKVVPYYVDQPNDDLDVSDRMCFEALSQVEQFRLDAVCKYTTGCLYEYKTNHTRAKLVNELGFILKPGRSHRSWVNTGAGVTCGNFMLDILGLAHRTDPINLAFIQIVRGLVHIQEELTRLATAAVVVTAATAVSDEKSHSEPRPRVIGAYGMLQLLLDAAHESLDMLTYGTREKSDRSPLWGVGGSYVLSPIMQTYIRACMCQLGSNQSDAKLQLFVLSTLRTVKKKLDKESLGYGAPGAGVYTPTRMTLSQFAKYVGTPKEKVRAWVCVMERALGTETREQRHNTDLTCEQMMEYMAMQSMYVTTELGIMFGEGGLYNHSVSLMSFTPDKPMDDENESQIPRIRDTPQSNTDVDIPHIDRSYELAIAKRTLGHADFIAAAHELGVFVLTISDKHELYLDVPRPDDTDTGTRIEPSAEPAHGSVTGPYQTMLRMRQLLVYHIEHGPRSLVGDVYVTHAFPGPCTSGSSGTSLPDLHTLDPHLLVFLLKLSPTIVTGYTDFRLFRTTCEHTATHLTNLIDRVEVYLSGKEQLTYDECKRDVFGITSDSDEDHKLLLRDALSSLRCRAIDAGGRVTRDDATHIACMVRLFDIVKYTTSVPESSIRHNPAEIYDMITACVEPDRSDLVIKYMETPSQPRGIAFILFMFSLGIIVHPNGHADDVVLFDDLGITAREDHLNTLVLQCSSHWKEFEALVETKVDLLCEYL